MSDATYPRSADPLRLLPPIRRARLWRLYAEDGRRFLDLWQDGGRSVLGAKGVALGRELKAAIDVGLGRPFPSVRERRLGKELARRWPWFRSFRLYRNEDRALAALARLSGGVPPPGGVEEGCAFLRDPARLAVAGLSPAFAGAAGGPGSTAPSGAPASGALASGALASGALASGALATGEEALLLRPFAAALGPEGSGGAGERVALPLLPCPRPFAPGVLLFRDEADAERVGPSDLVPPLSLQVALRSLLELEAYEASVGEDSWRRADRRLGRLFARRGPWLLPLVGPERYGTLFREALARGVLLSPRHDLPSILPGDFDDGELKPLADLDLR